MSDQTLTCTCRKVALGLEGGPIVSVECLCADCQNAATQLQSWPDAPLVLDQNGATRFVLYRKDRVRCLTGEEWLREHRLTEDSKTRRVVAVYCKTPMFLEFKNGHWLSIYGGRWPEETLPPLEMRTMCRDRPEDVELPDDVPNPKTHTLAFYARLLRAWAAMGFRTPEVGFVHGKLEAQ